MTALPVSSYVSLTTFRRTRVPVSTPVWAAPDGDTLVVWTRADSGKRKHPLPPAARRLASGPCRGPRPAAGRAAGFVAHAEWPEALASLRRTYGFRFQAGYVTSRVLQRFSRSDTDRNEIIRIRPTTA